MKLGVKGIKFEYIPFSKLVNPLEVLLPLENIEYFGKLSKKETVHTIPTSNSRPISTVRTTDIEALKCSILKHKLLNPLTVVEITKDFPPLACLTILGREVLRDLSQFVGRYVIVDGQRRYFAIKEIFDICDIRRLNKIKLEAEEEKRLSPFGESHQHLEDYIAKQEKKMNLLIPCLVYPYKTWKQMKIHSVEDNKFSVKPSEVYLNIAERTD